MARPDRVVRSEESYEERILNAAYLCFEKFSYAKTSIEDIAREAQLSRPTIYKYFGSKEVIYEQISILECRKLSAELRRKIDRSKNTPEKLVDTIIYVTRYAMENVYLRSGLEASLSSRAQTRGSVLQQEYLSLWGGFIERALERGDLAADLTPEEIVHWIVANEGMLMMRLEREEVSDEELRRVIARLVVYPLLPPRDVPAPRSTGAALGKAVRTPRRREA